MAAGGNDIYISTNTTGDFAGLQRIACQMSRSWNVTRWQTTARAASERRQRSDDKARRATSRKMAMPTGIRESSHQFAAHMQVHRCWSPPWPQGSNTRRSANGPSVQGDPLLLHALEFLAQSRAFDAATAPGDGLPWQLKRKAQHHPSTCGNGLCVRAVHKETAGVKGGFTQNKSPGQVLDSAGILLCLTLTCDLPPRRTTPGHERK